MEKALQHILAVLYIIVGVLWVGFLIGIVKFLIDTELYRIF